MKTAKKVQKEMNMIVEGLGDLWMYNYLKSSFTKKHRMHSLYAAIGVGFSWAQTRQGYEFWHDLAYFFKDMEAEEATDIESWHQKAERETLEKIKNKYTPSDDFADELSTWRPIDGVYQFDKQKLERLNKLYTPTDHEVNEPLLYGNHFFTVVNEDGLHSCDQLTFEIYGQLIKLGRVYGNK